MQRIKTILVITFFSGTLLFAQKGDDVISQAIPRVEIPGSQVLKIKSSVVGQQYDLYIHLPGNYQDTSKSFPVLYLLDAQWDFTLMTALYGQQYYDGFVPSIIIVGITWGGINPNPDSLRVRDFTPTTVKEFPQSGGAEKFQTFLRTELIPFIDNHFRTVKNDRALAGSSLGGLFTLYSLFNHSELFNRYFLTSPALSWDKKIHELNAKIFSEKHVPKKAKLFMAEGSLEDGVQGFEKFEKNITSLNIAGLEMQSKVLDGVGHSGGKAEGYTRGLQFVYQKTSLVLSSDILQQYVGTYQVNESLKVNILRKDGHLIGEISGGSKFVLKAESEMDFYLSGQYLFIHFVKDSVGKVVTGFVMKQFGGENFVKKIE